VVTLVGYTNAGKSTLLNRLTQADVYTADQLFATLDPTTRRVELPGGNMALIQKLPTQLVAAFRATLEEISEADLLLHVVDITHPNAFAQWKAVQNTLVDINADHIPVVTAFNKIDRLPQPENALEAIAEYPNAVSISAKTGAGLPDMLRALERTLFETYEPIQVRLPYQQGQLISLFHEQGKIESTIHERQGVIMTGQIPGRLLAQFQPFLYTPTDEIEE